MTAPGPGLAPDAPVRLGTTAPDFTLKDQNNEDFSLGDYRGQRAVLVVFYPFAFTGICTNELCALRDEPVFAGPEVTTVTISCDTVYAHKVFADREGFSFPLLSDFWPHGEVSQAYGVFNPDGGFANRGTFLVDRDGVVRFAEVNGPGRGRDPQAWLAAIAALPSR